MTGIDVASVITGYMESAGLSRRGVVAIGDAASRAVVGSHEVGQVYALVRRGVLSVFPYSKKSSSIFLM